MNMKNRFSKSGSGLSGRAKAALGALALAITAGTVSAQPLRIEYDVQVQSPGIYEYWFKMTVDDTFGPYNPGMGWGWLSFGTGRRGPFLRTSPMFNVTSPWPIGPWNPPLTSVGGSINGPMFPTTPHWIPTGLGDFIEWRGTSQNYVPPGNMRFGTAQISGGAPQINHAAAIRVSPDPVGSCCLGNGMCLEVSSVSCANAGGVYAGDGTTCASDPCNPPTGACCRTSGCVITNAGLCADVGGTYQGNGTVCATAGCAPAPAFSLTPPDFSAESRVWTYSPSHEQVLSGGGFRATGFRLSGRAGIPIEGRPADILMELIAPNGTTLLLGADGVTPLVPNSMSYPAIRRTGTSPSTSNAPVESNFDGVYSWDMGPVDGTWKVNFWNNFQQTLNPHVPSRVDFRNIVVEILDAGSGSCCLPDGSCLDTAIGNCLLQNGFYRGNNTVCGGCRIFLPLAQSVSSLTNLNGGAFLDIAAAKDLKVYELDYYSTAAAGTPTTVEIYTRNGSYANFDGDPAGWTLHDTVAAISAGVDNSAPLVLNTPLEIPGGKTVGVSVVAVNGGLRFLSTSAFAYENQAMTVVSERTRTALFGGTAGTSRALSGRVYFETPPCTGSSCSYQLITPHPTIATSTANNGIFFDVTAQTDLTITSVEYFSGLALNNASTATLYYKTGSHIGFDTDPSAWTLLGDYQAISGANVGAIPMEFAPIQVAENETIAFYVVGTVGGYRYRAATTPDPFSDGNLSMTSSFGRSALFGGTLQTNRRFAGRVVYTTGAAPQPCYANCDGSTVEPVLNIDDFTCFINEFATGQSLPPEQQVTAYANCDGSTTQPVLNIDDFTCFINSFAQGCP